MKTQKEILEKIKSQVLSVVPDAHVYLFGSRARGDFHEESDWDILIKTKNKPDYRLKDKIRQKIYPISVDIFDFINTIIVSENDWENDPGYFSLHRATQHELIHL
jgi:predicted nucleotidyltransferase